MGLLRLTRRAPREQPPSPERPEVTEYRDLLLSAPREQLVAVHHQVLPTLDLFVRAVILNTARGLTGTGAGLAPEDTAGLTELLLVGDGAQRVAILAAYDDGVRHRLAHRVVEALRPVEEPAPPEPEVEEAAPAEQPQHEPVQRRPESSPGVSRPAEPPRVASVLP